MSHHLGRWRLDEDKGDFQLKRALDVLKFGSVAATPKMPKPSARLADATKAAPKTDARK